MPVTVHKVLFHGKEIIKSAIVPIGQMSEEAQEARNKDIRRYREFFTRKTSRVNTNKDLMNRLLISSDPYITSMRKSIIKPEKTLSKKALELLKAEVYNSGEDIELFSSSDSESNCKYCIIYVYKLKLILCSIFRRNLLLFLPVLMSFL